MWIQRALNGWDALQSDALRLTRAPLPWMILYDASCAWDLEPDDAILVNALSANAALVVSGKQIRVRVRALSGTVLLPNGAPLPSQAAAYTSFYKDGTAPFFVMALPDVWRRDPDNARDPFSDEFFLGVAMHELTHTRQLLPMIERLRVIGEQYKLADVALNDDVVQNRFQTVDGFRAAFELERDQMFRAAAEQDPRRRRALAVEALKMIRTRQARYYTGSDRAYKEFEEVFLSMEGAGQWAAYTFAKRDTRADASDSAVVDFVRSTRKYWVQEEGLALFLLIDRFVPDWQRRIFGSTYVSPVDMLERSLTTR
jgi:rubrerythrin